MNSRLSSQASCTREVWSLAPGVVIGSNVFNLAALLGLGAVVAGEIRLYRRVIVLEELTASTLGTRYHVAEIVTGALVLAGVTSLPNAVSALYLALRGRGAATRGRAV